MMDLEYFKVGHTHCLNDMRFSIVKRILSKNAKLEDLGAFKNAIQAGMPNYRGLPLVVEQVAGSWDFKEYYEVIPLKISGLIMNVTFFDGAVFFSFGVMKFLFGCGACLA